MNSQLLEGSKTILYGKDTAETWKTVYFNKEIFSQIIYTLSNKEEHCKLKKGLVWSNSTFLETCVNVSDFQICD